MAVVSVLAGDAELAAVLEEIGGQWFLDALGELVEDYEDEATYVIDDVCDDDPETVGGEEVWIWTLIALHRTPSTVGAMIDAVVPVYPVHEPDDADNDVGDDSDEVPNSFVGSSAYLRLTLVPNDRKWTVLSWQYLPHDLGPYRESELSPGVIECPLCHAAPASEVLFGLPDPMTERRAVAAGMIFGGDVLGAETLGITHGCRTCGYRWGEEKAIDEPEPTRADPPRCRAEAARRGRRMRRMDREPPGPTAPS
jgi:hypothetical protein